jgi:uncharacterized protein YndB with AHSA1/START domain
MKIFRFILIVIAIIFAVLGATYLFSGGKTEIVNHVTIHKAPKIVFDYISDMRNELKWNPDVLYMEKKTAGDIREGTKFRAKWHLSDTLEVSITRFEPPHVITFENGGPVEVILQVTLNPADSITELESRFIATPHGVIRAIFPIFRYSIQKQERENMGNLKKAIENLTD